jgi:hypothetical protein
VSKLFVRWFTNSMANVEVWRITVNMNPMPACLVRFCLALQEPRQST